MPDGQLATAPDERQPQHQRMIEQEFHPPRRPVPSGLQSEIREDAGLPIDERLGPEPLGKPFQFAGRRRPNGEVDEVRPDTPFRKEPQRLAHPRIFPDSEYLYFQPCQPCVGWGS